MNGSSQPRGAGLLVTAIGWRIGKRVSAPLARVTTEAPDAQARRPLRTEGVADAGPSLARRMAAQRA